MGISADRELCVGAGQCVLAAPAVFDQDDDGLVVVNAPDQPVDATIEDAVHLCPAGAIRHG